MTEREKEQLAAVTAELADQKRRNASGEVLCEVLARGLAPVVDQINARRVTDSVGP